MNFKLFIEPMQILSIFILAVRITNPQKSDQTNPIPRSTRSPATSEALFGIRLWSSTPRLFASKCHDY